MGYETDTKYGPLCSTPIKETQHKQHKDTLTQAKSSHVTQAKGNLTEATVQYTNEGDQHEQHRDTPVQARRIPSKQN